MRTVDFEPRLWGQGIAAHRQHCALFRFSLVRIQRASATRLGLRRISWGIVARRVPLRLPARYRFIHECLHRDA